MERLTMTSDKGGVAFAFDLDIACEKSEIMKILKVAEKLKEYEDLEEQGQLLRLPCAVGDTVYQHMIVGIDMARKKPIYEIAEATVFKFSLDSFTLCFLAQTVGRGKQQNELPLSAFGKSVFLTKEQAEQALKEMEDKQYEQ